MLGAKLKVGLADGSPEIVADFRGQRMLEDVDRLAMGNLLIVDDRSWIWRRPSLWAANQSVIAAISSGVGLYRPAVGFRTRGLGRAEPMPVSINTRTAEE